MNTAANFLTLLEPVSVLLSVIMQSPASNNLNGNLIDLFSPIVLSKPGNKLVLPVWNYLVLAFYIVINFDSSLLKIFVVRSAFEHKAKFNA